jgi:tRNA pseudouridine(55) synthase
MLQSSFLTLDKPIGARSTKCVEEIRRILGRGVKVGHGGTLDSSASGLLVILISGATRLSNLVTQMPKIYRATVKLGSETSTCDFTGEALFSSEWSGVNEDEIDSLLPAFLGWRLQTPPKVSAIHLGGRRAHDIFRRGGDPEIQPRPVFIERIKREGPISPEGEFRLFIRCGKGTYVRSVARDIGRALGCGAHLSSLRRESVGGFTLDGAVAFGDGFNLDRERLESALVPISALGDFLPAYALPQEDVERLSNGLSVFFSRASRSTFGRFCPPGAVAFNSKTLFCVARLESFDGEICALPEVNIFNENPKGIIK